MDEFYKMGEYLLRKKPDAYGRGLIPKLCHLKELSFSPLCQTIAVSY